MPLRCVAMFLVLGAASWAAHPVAAQEPPTDSRLSAGAFWTANIASFSLDPRPDRVEARQWTGGGVTLDVPLVPGLSIDARVLWNRRGARVRRAGLSGHQDLAADYLSMPVLFKASGRGLVRPYVLGGGEFSLRTRAKLRTVRDGLETDDDAKTRVGATDASLVVGAGIERSMAASHVFVEGLYAHGLRNVTPGATTAEATRMRTLTLLAGVRF